MHNVIFVLLGAILIALVFVSGCTSDVSTTKAHTVYSRADAEKACIQLCENVKSGGMDLSKGPCLSNQVVKDWVCDIAHKPRQPVDNMPENQCTAFMRQEAHHFIELDENCNLIQFY
ncbi:MAG: hypothetical protein GXO64_03950 [Candidatus Micrarchaeota archaeon]|nr:hypothetical protein [Candidatus Micrarchaeota archaeon]